MTSDRHSRNIASPPWRVTSRVRWPFPAGGWLRVVAALVLVAAWVPGRGFAGSESWRVLPNPFFAFDNGLMDEAHQTLAAKAQTLAELGYDGIGWRPGNVPAMRAELEKRGLRMFSLYTGLQLDATGDPWDPRLPETLAQLRGAGTIVWLTVTRRSHRPSDPAGDRDAVALIRRLADMAAAHGLRVALYPHHGFWLQTTEDAIRVAEQVDRPDVGVSFNLCHCLRAGNGPRIPEILRRAAPRLFLVSINGADREGRNWGQLIRPLDEGDMDLLPVLARLQALGYTGPIGLQCYGLRGPARENLARSMAAWRRYQERLRAERPGAAARPAGPHPKPETKPD